MVVECLAITIIILAISVLYLRTRRKQYALATIPLVLLPASNVMLAWAARYAERVLPFSRASIAIAIFASAALVSCVMAGVFSSHLTKKYTRASYLFMSIVFNVILLMILINTALLQF